MFFQKKLGQLSIADIAISSFLKKMFEEGGKIKIVIEEVPPSLNVLLRLHWAERRKLQERWDDLIFAGAWRSGWRKKDPYFKEVSITYQFRNIRKRDRDNFAPKIIMDSLQRNGIIEGDSPEEVSYDWSFKSGPSDRTIIELS